MFAVGFASAMCSVACSDATDTGSSRTSLGRDVPDLVFPNVPPGWTGTGSSSSGGSSGSSGSGGTGGSSSTGGASTGSSSSTGGSSSIDADPPPSGLSSVYCGDWARDTATEECDLGPDAPFVACSANCQTLDFLLFEPPTAPPVGEPNRRAVRLGNSPHQLATTEQGLAVAFMYPDEQEVALRLLDKHGNRGAEIPLGEGTTFCDPAVASIGNSLYVAWNDLNGDGSELGVTLRRVDAATEQANAPIFANATTVGAQSAPDVVAVGSTLVVAWTDTSDPNNGPDVVMRRFDANLNPMAGEVALGNTALPEGNVALASRGGTWAAAWRESQSNGKDVIVVWADGEKWRINAGQPGPAEDRPTLAFLDASHIFVVFTSNTDPENTGVRNIPRLVGAVVELGSTTAQAPSAIQPLQANYAGSAVEKLAVGQHRPRLVAANGQHYLAWQSGALLADARSEELWLKRLYWDAVAEQVWFNVAEEPLPRSDAHRDGDQREVALLGTPLVPEGALLMAWTDYGSTLSPNQGHPDVALQLAPLPLRRGDAVEDCSSSPSGCAPGSGPCTPNLAGQCQAGSSCVEGRGPWYGYGPTTPVCVPDHCTNQVKDLSSGETDVDCGGECGPCYDCPRDELGHPDPSQLGTNGFCSAVCPCKVTEGDCDSDTDCVGTLACIENFGAQHAPPFPDEIDLCLPPECVVGNVLVCGGPLGHADYCKLQSCNEGEGDCDGDSECGAGLYCGSGAGSLYGMNAGVDVCRPLACTSNAVQPNTAGYCSTGCRCGTGTGVCTSDAQCLSGSVCKARGLSYGKAAELSVCTPSHCTNGLEDGDEDSVDCGGTCGVCTECATNELFASFEDTTRPWAWAPGYVPTSLVTTAPSATATRGSGSLQVKACGWVDLMSTAHSTADIGVVGDELWLDIFIPATVPNTAYVGNLRLSVSVPGAGITDLRLDAITTNGLAQQYPLTALPRGSWSKLRFQGPAALQAAYHQDIESARFRIGLSTANCTAGAEPPFLLDNLRFGGSQAAFRSICNQPNLAASSVAENFSFEQLEVWRDAFGGPSALTPETQRITHLVQAARVPQNQTLEVRSGYFTAADIAASDRLRLDLLVPSPPSGSVTGSITATGSCQGTSVINLGSQTLSGRPYDVYTTLAFTVPSSFQTILAGSYSQCAIKLSFTSAGLDEPLRIDNVRFGAPTFCEDNQLSNVAPFALNQTVTPNGTQAAPYPLCNVAQMQTLVNTSSLWTKYFVLKQDIDLATLAGRVTGNFSGTFDGGGYELSNYVINAPTVDNVGLFASAPGVVKNLRVRAFSVTGKNGVGTVAGNLGSTGRLENIQVIGGQVSGVDSVGGLAGSQMWPACNLLNSSSSAPVTGSSKVGGLVGYGADGTLSQSSATGDVTGSGLYVGGLVGYQGGAVLVDTFATGNISSSSDAIGGLSGLTWGPIIRSYATGSVRGAANVGGLAGETNGPITHSFATGNVSGTTSVGGLVGRAGWDIIDSYASGSVTLSGTIGGGLVGYAGRARIQRAFATGSVTSIGTSGGLVGQLYSPSLIRDSYSWGSVSSGPDIGGFVGYLRQTSSVDRSYERGSVTGTTRKSAFVANTESTVRVGTSFFDSTINPSIPGISGAYVPGANAVVAKTTAELQQQSTFSTAGWDFTSVWKMGASGFPQLATIDFCSTIPQQSTAPFQILPVIPDGSASNPYRICNVAQFQTLVGTPSLWNKTIVLAADLDISTVTGTIGGIFAGSDIPFTGTFDGRGHILRNYTRSGTNDVGLFGHVVGDGVQNGVNDGRIVGTWLYRPSSSGTINVGSLIGRIENGFVEESGTISPTVQAVAAGTPESIGGLIGAAVGTIVRACEAHGVSINGGGGVKIGGLVGSAVGGSVEACVVNNGTITALTTAQSVGGLGGTVSTVVNSRANVTINGGGFYVGGLLGVALVSVDTSSSGWGVNASAAQSVGGLIGWSDANVSNSTTNCGVTGTSAVGGAIGTLRGIATKVSATGTVAASSASVGGFAGVINGGSAIRSYSTAAVTAGTGGIAGGFVGDAVTATISDCYTTSNVTNASGAACGGFAGRVDGSTISRVYELGSVSGASTARGGFVGTAQGAVSTFSSVFHATNVNSPELNDIGQDSTGIGPNPVSISGVPLATLTVTSTFTGWNSTTIWNITGGSYPTLK